MKNKVFKNGIIFNGDCLAVMSALIKKGVKVDAIITDPPYGTTSCKWDIIIPFEAMWERLNKLIKDNGSICLFGKEPFSSALRMSNVKKYKYDWYWDKIIPSGMCNAKIQPMSQTENISIFMNGKSYYYPQMIKRDKPIKSGGMKDSRSGGTVGLKKIDKVYNEKYPTTILTFDKVRKGSLHPTQKPLALMEYLIKTYTKENEIVLDFTMGSGTTCVACQNTNRKFIGIELDEKYFDIASKRIEENEI